MFAEHFIKFMRRIILTESGWWCSSVKFISASMYQHIGRIEYIENFEIIIYRLVTCCYARRFRHTYRQFVTLVCRWKERPSPRLTKESPIRFHKISINRPLSSALNSTGKRDRKLRFSTHGETYYWHALFNLSRWYRRQTLIIPLEEK